MDTFNSVISFEIKYAGKIIFCEAVLQPTCYQIFFNGQYMAHIEQNASFAWIQTDGRLLLQSTIEEIGAHIDGHLD
jgi:hypothetical protein